MTDKVQILFYSVLTSMVSYLLGGFDKFIEVLLIVTTIDILTLFVLPYFTNSCRVDSGKLKKKICSSLLYFTNNSYRRPNSARVRYRQY